MNQKFYSLKPQFYLDLWSGDQAFSNKNLKDWDFKHKLKKALSGWHSHLLFDSSFLENPNFNYFIKSALAAKPPAFPEVKEQNQAEKKAPETKTRSNIKPALQISPAQFQKYKNQILEINKTYKNNLDFHIICGGDKQIPLKELEAFNSSLAFVWLVTRKNKNRLLNMFSKSFAPYSSHKNWLYFPYKKHLFDSFLSPRQVYNFIKKCPKIPIYPTEIYDSRIPQDMDLEPCIQPFAQNKLPDNKIYFSVIIPSYNSKAQLINTLKHLAKQVFPRNEYEVIAVDDGSSDNTRQALADFVKQHPGLNITALHFPRVIERKTGDSRFRAGLARNLGVKHSSGKLLAFLDSDILTPPDYLTKLKKEHEKADLILLKRYHLKAKTPIEDLFSSHNSLKKSYYIEDKKYWGAFYKKGFDQINCPWKYICTYGLSLPKKDFIAAGAFGKNFIFYGFEDTDLGYRLFKKNKKFLLSDIEVYHQAPSDTAKSGWNYPLLRQKQLAKTAKIFFYRHLDPEIYQELSIYMRQEGPLSYFFPFLQK